ncbi:MAG: response regulator [Hyphomicrobium sp.]|jgi:DNA-binding NtrC family response regulator|uniref:response regulator n=2 Tax=Hyphomicrobium TaxID=81 RepID=UPI0025C27DDC|nr:response regulator [Hyphomicrobium sp.]MBX9863168.1 response regulator [Hyphomicrobium sp.]
MSVIPRNGEMRAGKPVVGVLIVEDSWNVALSLKGIVEQAGARAIGPVPTVREALRVVETQPIALALVDMNLKDHFADPLVDVLIARNIPYAIITAYDALPTDADRAAIDRMNKPLDHARISALIAAFTGNQPGKSIA